MKKVHFLDTVEIYYYNKDSSIHKIKPNKLYNLENKSNNYTIIIIVLVILWSMYIIF